MFYDCPREAFAPHPGDSCIGLLPQPPPPHYRSRMAHSRKATTTNQYYRGPYISPIGCMNMLIFITSKYTYIRTPRARRSITCHLSCPFVLVERCGFFGLRQTTYSTYICHFWEQAYLFCGKLFAHKISVSRPAKASQVL